jgi:exopolysaccharide biosynthesis polyprenyl glycosylphosphotransferase
MSTIRITNEDIKTSIPTQTRQGPLWQPNKGIAFQTAARRFVLVDEKAWKMEAIYAEGDFTNTRRQIHLLQNWWFARTHLVFLAKRALDLVISISALLFFLPVFLITAVLIKIDSPGPIFFRQQRVGKWGKTFNCFKFRSMFIDAEKRKLELLVKNEADEVVFKMRNDPRVTRVGRVIRKFSIDELPQLINVIQGDMSLVGPRPPVPIEVAQYEHDQFRRLDAVPGITGLQQVSGRSELAFKRWVELDVEYIEHWSLKKDVEIILKTIPAVISGKGAY